MIFLCTLLVLWSALSNAQCGDSQLLLDVPIDGGLADVSGNGNVLGLSGATLVNDRNGNANGALSFDGNDYVQASNDPDFANMTSAFTISAWFNPTFSGTFEHPLVSKVDGSNRNIVLRCHNDGRLQAHFAVGGSLSFLNSSTGVVQAGVWQHTVLTWDGSTMTMYLDGAMVAQNTFAQGPTIASTGQFLIGALTLPATETFVGSMDEVVITSQYTPEERVACLMNRGLTPEDGLVLHVPFDGNTNDVSSVANPSTPTSVTSASDRFFESGMAYSFNGSTSQVMFSNNAAYSAMASAFTVTAWIYPTIVSGNRTIVSKIGSGRDFVLNIIDGKLSGHYYLGGYHWCTSPTANIPLNQWSHVALVWDGTYMSVYVDAVQAQSVDFSPSGPTITTNPLRIGNLSGSGEAFAGRIDEVKMWDRALNQCELERDNYAKIDLFDQDELTVCSNQTTSLAPSVEMCSFEWPDNSTDATFNFDASQYATGVNAIALNAYDYYGRLQQDTIYVTVDLCVGISDSDRPTLSVWPNPTTGIITVSGMQVRALTVSSIDGRTVGESATNRFDLGALSEGIYTVTVLMMDGSINQHKVVKIG